MALAGTQSATRAEERAAHLLRAEGLRYLLRWLPRCRWSRACNCPSVSGTDDTLQQQNGGSISKKISNDQVRGEGRPLRAASVASVWILCPQNNCLSFCSGRRRVVQSWNANNSVVLLNCGYLVWINLSIGHSPPSRPSPNDSHMSASFQIGMKVCNSLH